MRKRNITTIMNWDFLRIILILVLVYRASGLKGVGEIFNTTIKMLSFINLVSINITGDSILVTLFATSLEYAIVGLIFKIFKIKKDNFGKIVGKLSFYLVSFPVTFILNFIAIEALKI